MEPHIQVLFGDDELAITEYVKSREKELGDPVTAEMNITRLDGRTFNPDELLRVAAAMPFLASRRIVVISNCWGRFKQLEDAQRSFLANLEKIPATTLLLLTGVLEEKRDVKKFLPKWFTDWASKHPGKVKLDGTFTTPAGRELEKWIEKRAVDLGGKISPDAAALMVSMVGEEPRQLDQEVLKLLTYVNFKRKVEPDDVEKLIVNSAQVNIFELVDAISDQNKHKAVRLLHRMLDDEDPFMLFAMIIRQFSFLLFVRDCLDHSAQLFDVGKAFALSDWQLQRFSSSARRFALPLLETVYRRLLEIDEMVKTGKMELPLALETFVVGFTS